MFKSKDNFSFRRITEDDNMTEPTNNGISNEGFEMDTVEKSGDCSNPMVDNTPSLIMRRPTRKSANNNKMKLNKELSFYHNKPADNREELNEEERRLHSLLLDAETDMAMDLLRNPLYKINMDKTDFFGRTFLSNAVLMRSEVLIDFLLSDEFPSFRGEVNVGDALTHAVSIKDHNITEKLLVFLKGKGKISSEEVDLPYIDEDTRKNMRKIKKKIKANLDNSTSSILSVASPRPNKRNTPAELGAAITKFGPSNPLYVCKCCDRVHKNGGKKSVVHKISKEVYCFKEDLEYYSADFTVDLLENPMILACKNDDYPIITLFDSWGFAIGDMEASLSDLKLDVTNSIESYSRFYRYKALCSSSHIDLKDKDNVLRCFKLSERLMALASMEPEFNEVYTRLAKQVRMYSVDLLDNCRDSCEVEQMLSRIDGLEEVVEANSQVAITFCPRLHLAIHKAQKEFVVHPHCQKQAGFKWNAGLKPYELIGIGWIFTHFLVHLIMLPLSSLYLIFKPDLRKKPAEEEGVEVRVPVEEEESGGQSCVRSFDFESPRSRALRFFASYIIFLGILSFEIIGLEHRNMEIYGCYLSAVELLILLYVIGYSKSIVMMIRANGAKLFFDDIWNSYDFVNMALFILSFATWGLGFELYIRGKHIEVCNATLISRHQWNQEQDFMQYSEIAFLVATIMSFLRILQICQIHRVLGPIQLILLRTFKDVSYMMVVFMVFVLCYSLGIQMLYSNFKEIDWQILEDPLSGLPKCERMDPSYFRLRSTIKVLLWDIFGYGFIDSPKIFMPNIKFTNNTLVTGDLLEEIRKKLCRRHNMTHEYFDSVREEYGLSKSFDKNLQLITEIFGYFIVWMYHMIMIVLLLNLLIAMMSQSYSDIQSNADLEWKFNLTVFRLRYCNPSLLIPPPFNLIPRLQSVLNLFKCCKWKETSEITEKEEEYAEALDDFRFKKLQRQLHKRLLNGRKGNKTENNEILEHTLEILHDTNTIVNLNREIKSQVTYKLKQT